MREVILDTNFLLIPVQFKVDIFSEIERLVEEPHKIIVPDVVVDELRKLSGSRGKDGRAARFALKIVEEKKKREELEIIEGGERPVDKWLLEFAGKKKAYLGTNDIGMRKKARKKNIKVFVLRERNHLEII